MFRRIFTSGLKFPLCPTYAVRQQMIMTVISKSFANQTQHQVSSEKSPFMKYREIKKPENLVQQNKIEIKLTSEPSDLSNLLKKAVTESEKLVKNSDLLEKLDHSALETITDNFWRLYFAHKRLISNSRFFQGKMTFGAYLPKGYNLYLLNSAVANPEILKSMRNLFEKLTKVYELNEKDILSKHQTYIEAVRCFSKFEICHEYQNFWNIMYRFVEERIARAGTFTEKEINLLSACLKVLSRHKYYLKNHEQLQTSLKMKEDLKQTEEIQKKLFDFFIINNQLEREASGWVTLLIEFHLAEDDLFQPLGTFLAKRFKNIDESSDLAWSLSKIVKFLHNKYFATLFTEMKQTVLKKAARNQLTIEEISLVLRSLVVENPKFPEENLELLWTNLNHNIRDKKSEDFDLYDISSIMTNLTFSKHLTSERFWFLQECALLSFDKSKSKYLNPQVEHQKNEDIDEDAENLEDPNEFSLSDSKIRFVTECVKILGNLGQREAIKKINFDFLQKLLLTIRENLDNIVGSNLADLFISLAKLDQKCRENTTYKALKDKEMNFLKTRTYHILKKINIFKAKDVAKVFQSYCILGYMGEIEYKLFCDTISQKLHLLQPYYCMQILQGVADLKKNPKTPSFQTDRFEKAVVDRIILSLGTLSKEEFMVTIYPIQLLKELTYINELSQAVGVQLLKHINALTFKEISYKTYSLDSVKTLSHDFLARLKPAIINKINEADRKALFYLISTYTKNNSSPPGLFESLEKAVQKQIQNYMQKKLKNKDELKEFLMIFTSLAKFKFENAGLAKDFEALFEQNLAEFSAQDLIYILNGMTIYSSSNLDLLKSLLAALNTEVILQKDSFYKLTPSQNISAFQQGMFSIELEYGDTINLKEYSDIFELHKYLEENIESVRYKQSSVSIYQSHVFEDLKGMKYDIQEEYPIGVFVSDLIIKPKTILEITGPVHYIHGTKTLVLKSQRKLRQLQKLGYKVAVIPYFEWEEVEKTHYRAKYLQKKIED